jgi:hypothetical protein
MNIFLHLWQYFADFFLEWEMLHMKAVEKIETHILCLATFLRKSCVYNIEKRGGVREAADNMAPAHGILDK